MPWVQTSVLLVSTVGPVGPPTGTELPEAIDAAASGVVVVLMFAVDRIPRAQHAPDIERIVADIGDDAVREAVAEPHPRLCQPGQLVKAIAADIARLGENAASQIISGPARYWIEHGTRGRQAPAFNR